MLYLLLFLFTHTFAQEWIDPHDMNANYVTKEPNRGVYPDKSLVINNSQSSTNDVTLSYLKRIISLLISSAIPNDENILKGKYSLNKDGEDYKFLMKFATNEKIDPQDLRQLDSILNSAFGETYTDNILNVLTRTNEYFLNLLNNKTLIVIGACIALYIFYYLLKTKFTFLYISKYFLFIIWILDYAFRYQVLLEEAEMHNIKVTSAQCNKDLSWFERYFFNVDGKCEKKVVTPIEVFLLQVRHIIIIPMSAFGTGTGQFTKELWSQLPFPWNLVLFPTILLMVLIMVPAIMTVLNDRSFKMNIMHLLQVQFGNNHEQQKDQISGSTLEKLLLSLNQRSSNMHPRMLYNSNIIRRNKEKKNNVKDGKWNKFPLNRNREKSFKPVTYQLKNVTRTETETAKKSSDYSPDNS